MQTALAAVYPPRCVGCGGVVDSDFGLCGICWADTPFIGSTICDYCGAPLPGDAGPDEVLNCDDCLVQPRPWRKGRAALLYRDQARKLILALKHGDRTDIVRPAGQWMARAGADILNDPKTMIAPVPLHRMRLLKRRYNQSALLAQRISKATQRAICVDLLQRHQPTPSLDGKSKEDRFTCLEGAISVTPRRRYRLIGRPVVLVDDVMTSGATLAACTTACLQSGADHVSVLTLARVVRGD